jgi:hypothetical protein
VGPGEGRSSRPRLTIIQTPGWHGGGVQLVMKSASTWLLTAWRPIGDEVGQHLAHLATLPVMLGLWSMALSGYEVTTEIL